ncbi:MAG: DNA polymerase I [Candidatus Fermentibacteraceae bacterium]|nr:DNA polymerase I [Candidatus Fermentibacteraceae bacterium]MBN2607661.1 DNA polymerase I [Candidatus Fermentibacteraceae bacterium]
MSEKLILLVDCHALLYRGHFAMMRNPLRAADGTNTSGLFFLVREILDRRESRNPDIVAAVFDHPGPTFRVGLYPEYKANRPPMPEDLRKQSEYALRLIPALGVPVLRKEGLEADDIIAWLAQEAGSTGNRAEILSSDKDLLQLVSERVTVIRPGSREGQDVIAGKGDVEGIMGVRADQVADFLALTGDSSDNIPGARGIGRKTAIGLLRDHGSLEGVYSSLDRIPPQVSRKLEESREMVELSRRLVTLCPARDAGIGLEDLSMSYPDEPAAVELLSSLGMSSIIDRLGLSHGPGPGREKDLFGSIREETAGARCSVKVVRSIPELKEMEPGPTYEGLVAIDTETTSRDPFQADPVGLSIATSGSSAWYAPLSGPDALDLEQAIGVLGGKLAGKNLVAQNGKYDMHVLENLGLRIPVLSGDPMIADYLLRPEIQSHSLSNLSVTWLGKTMTEYGEVLGNSDTLIDVATDRVADYCGCDSATALELSGLLLDRLSEDPRLLSIYRDVELPLVRVIADMEARGVGLDIRSLHELESEFSLAIAELEERAAGTAGSRLNLSSPSQVSRVLFEQLGLSPVRKTSTGINSSSMEVLEKLRGRHEFVDTVIEHRELSKLLNTYVRKLPGFLCPRDGLIHTSFSQTVTATGRLSSSNPNLQNIPIRTIRGRQVRKCFVPGRQGHVFITADYSQIELRILAHFAGPGNMRKAYDRNLDIHGRTAEAVFGDSSPEHRRKAKEVNFSILYGISPWGLSNRLNIGRGEATEIIDRYIETYPEVESYFRQCVEYAEKHGETRTILGRKREFKGMAKAKGAIRSSMERMAVNTTIQGSAADIIKLAMLRVHGRLAEMADAGLVLQVHDELVATAPAEMAEDVAEIIRTEMASAFSLEVPLVVDTGIGENWLEAQH